jgi:hypothetical protein
MKAKRFQEKHAKHMEALNHIEAIAFVKTWLIRTLRLTEELISIHSLILGNTSQRLINIEKSICSKENGFTHQIHKKFKRDRGAFNCYEINK